MVAGLLCLLIIFSAVSSLAEIVKIRSGTLVRLRASASTKAKVLDAFPKGTRVNVLDKGAIWCKVRVDGKVGYMMTKYLYSDTSSGSSGSGSSGGTTMYVSTPSGTTLNLRSDADTYSEILGAYRPGTKVTLLKRGRLWSKVSVNGLVGYMYTSYLSYTK